MKINKTERIVGTILLIVIFFGLYMKKDNEKRLQQQIEESIEVDTAP